MNIDHTNLLKALKHEDSHDILGAEKRKIVEEHHEWQTRKDETK